MTILVDEWLRSRQILQLPEPKRIKVAQDAQLATTVVGHPGWQFFIDSLDGILVELQRRMEAVKNQMVLSDDTLISLKLEARTLQGHIAGVTMAKELIPQAIKQGEQLLEQSLK